MEYVNPKDVPEDAQLIDLRSQMEWDDGHATIATHMPMEEIPSRYVELDLDQDIYLICRSAGRSVQVASWLERNGIDSIVVRGGMIDWEFDALPMTKGE
ncbi:MULTISPECIES: rhodanese-like domain-containing protein [unclassified Corynebacterium]|uniref:rhodanese-like domain-containing protein n=1 Tax=unclassified Corynebacterium TaxID=2624378 RepID=UPI003094C1E3